MFNKTIMYTKLAWVYVKGICGLRRKVYDLRFVYEPADKLCDYIYIKQIKPSC